MCLAPGVDIVYQLAQNFLVNIVEHRVVGTEDEVGWSIFQNLVDLGFQGFQVAILECLTAIVKTAKYWALEEFADVGKKRNRRPRNKTEETGKRK